MIAVKMKFLDFDIKVHASDSFETNLGASESTLYLKNLETSLYNGLTSIDNC